MDYIYKTLNKYKTNLEDMGYEVLYVGLYGSQNYCLDDELSDIDVKVIVMPTLDQIINRKVISKVYTFDEGDADVKDIITFAEVIAKGNFSYIESVHTEYSIGDKEVKAMFAAVPVDFKSVLGAMYEKRKALTHRYPSKIHEIDTYGYDGKQLHHMIRLGRIIDKRPACGYLKHEQVDDKQYLIDVKRNTAGIGLSDAIEYADNLLEQYSFKDFEYERQEIDVSSYIEKQIKVRLINESDDRYIEQRRTFGERIPNADLKRFPMLKEYEGEDITYFIYSELEINH